MKKAKLKSATAQLERALHKVHHARAEKKEAEFAADAASSKLTHVLSQADAVMITHDRIVQCKDTYNRIIIENVRADLTSSRKRANALNSAYRRLKKQRIVDKKSAKADRSKWPLAKQPPSVQAFATACSMDAVKAMEAADEMKDTISELVHENRKLKSQLQLSDETLKKAMNTCSNPENATDWIETLGKRGERYDMYVIEMGIQLMSSELSAAQAVYVLTIFMMKTYPGLVPGIDYRIPGESQFKEWAEAIYEVGDLVSITSPVC